MFFDNSISCHWMSFRVHRSRCSMGTVCEMSNGILVAFILLSM